MKSLGEYVTTVLRLIGGMKGEGGGGGEGGFFWGFEDGFVG